MTGASTGAGISRPPGSPSALRLDDLTDLAISGLRPMFDPVSKLFCHRMVAKSIGLVCEGASSRYTAMTLMGLQRWQRCGKDSPFEIGTILDALQRNASWMDNIGDIGLMLWLLAEAAPDRLGGFYDSMNLEQALERRPGVQEGRTMELAWFLTGLSCAAIARRDELRGMTDLAAGVYRYLEQNLGESGVFGHQSRGASFAGILRGRIGTFADQIYAIYAISRFVAAFEQDAPLSTARNCAEAICGAQGASGEWWCHYDSLTGEVVRRYPLFTVHHDALAPLALSSLGKIVGEDFSEFIAKGIGWIAGQNELGIDLRDKSAGVIWRGIHVTKTLRMYLDDMVGIIRTRPDEKAHRKTEVLRECRPYELGLLLYAFAEDATQ